MDFPKYNNYRINSRGFSLVELMVVIAIMGVLAAIVVPNYSEHIKRGKLTDAVNELAQLRLAMERAFQNTGTYAGTGTDPCAVSMPTGKYFTFTCTSASSPPTYTLTAKNIGSQGLGAAESYKYTINEGGVMQTAAYAGTTFDTPKSCWWIHQNDC